MLTATEQRFIWLSAIGWCVCLSGCGGLYDATITGVVTLGDSPLPRGTVTFYPDDGGPPAFGFVQSNGSYAVMTGREEGLPTGNYTATVVANEPSVQKDAEKGGPPAPGKPISPPWYRNKNESTLKFTVKPGANEINLPLTTEPPPGWKPPKKKRRGRRR